MAYQDRPNGPTLINKHSGVPGETLPPGALKPGEIAVNVDGTIYVRGEGGSSIAVAGPSQDSGSHHRHASGAMLANVIPRPGEILIDDNTGGIYSSDGGRSTGGLAQREQMIREGRWVQMTFNADGTVKSGQAALDDFNSGTMYAFNPADNTLIGYGLNEIVLLYETFVANHVVRAPGSAGSGGTFEYWASSSQTWAPSKTLATPGLHVVRIRGNPWGTKPFISIGQSNTFYRNDSYILAVYATPTANITHYYNITLEPNLNTSGVNALPSHIYRLYSQGASPYLSDDETKVSPIPTIGTPLVAINSDQLPRNHVFIPPIPAGSHAVRYDTTSASRYRLIGNQTAQPTLPVPDPYDTPDEKAAYHKKICHRGDILDFLYDLPAVSGYGTEWWGPRYQVEMFRGHKRVPDRLAEIVREYGQWSNSLGCVFEASFMKHLLSLGGRKSNGTAFSDAFLTNNEEKDIRYEYSYLDSTATASWPFSGAVEFVGDNVVPDTVTIEVAIKSSAAASLGSPPDFATVSAPNCIVRYVAKSDDAATSFPLADFSVSVSDLPNAKWKSMRWENSLGEMVACKSNDAFTNGHFWGTSTATIDVTTYPDLELLLTGPRFFVQGDQSYATIDGDPEGKLHFSPDADFSKYCVQTGVGKLTTTHYDALLKKLAREVSEGYYNGAKTLGVSTKTQHTAEGAADRAYLVSQGWTITDGGQA